MKPSTRLLGLSLMLVSAVGLRAVYADDTKPAASDASGNPKTLAEDTQPAASKPGASDSRAHAQSTALINDAITTTRVKMAFLEDQQIPSLDISVHTDGGVVTLTGAVKNADVIAHAVHLASAVDGVKNVRNSLVVEAD